MKAMIRMPPCFTGKSVEKIYSHEIHIWWARMDSPEWDVSDLHFLLSAEEISRAKRFYFPHHRRRFIVAHGLLRCILGKYINEPPACLEFCYGPTGKPHLSSKEKNGEICFSLSHSNEIACIGIALNRRTGVDVECIREVSNVTAIARRYFSASEFQTIMHAPPNERDRIFLYYWTMKEAYLKARGNGLSGLNDRDAPSFAAPPGRPVVISRFDQQWIIYPFETAPGYLSACCIEGDLPVFPVYRNIHPSFFVE